MADGGVKIDVGLSISKAEKDLHKLKEKIQKTEDQLNSDIASKSTIEKQLEKAGQAADAARQKLAALREEYNNSRGRAKAEIKPRLDNVAANYNESVKTADRLGREYAKVDERIQKATKDLGEMKGQAADMTVAIARAKPGEAIANSMKAAKKSMMTFLKYSLGIRSLFFLFRRLRSYISDAVGAFAQRDAETKNNIDGLKNSLATLKASWGAAFAPILNAVAPLLQRLISWLTTAVNAVNMFFSALTGKSTYKKVSAAMENVESGASGVASAEDDIAESAEEAKKQLMGFDEINRLDDTTGASKAARGGGGGAGGGVQEAEEAMINPKMQAFVDWFKKHLEEIKILAGTIGAILLAWKLSNALGTNFQKTLGVIMIIYGAAMMVKGALDAWQNGVDWENFRTMLGGIAVAVAGAFIAFGPIGAAIAMLVGGITMLITGFKDLVTQGELTDENFAALATGIGLVGGAFAILTGSWIPLLIAALGILVLWIAKNWDEIWAKTKEIWERISKFVTEKVQFVKEKIIEYFGPLIDDIKRIWNGCMEVFSGVIDFLLGIFTGDWQRAWDGVVQIFWGIYDQIAGIVLSIIDFVGGIISAIQDAISWIQSLNSYANQNAQFNVDTGNLYATDPSMLRGYATGGIVDRATALIAGENGKEAIVPLEHNTGWIDTLANGLMNSMAKSNHASILASAFSGVPKPAMAMGQVVPPNYGGGGGIGESDIARLLSAIQGIGTIGGGSGQHVAILEINGREFARATYDDRKAVEREHGMSLIVNG